MDLLLQVWFWERIFVLHFLLPILKIGTFYFPYLRLSWFFPSRSFSSSSPSYFIFMHLHSPPAQLLPLSSPFIFISFLPHLLPSSPPSFVIFHHRLVNQFWFCFQILLPSNLKPQEKHLRSRAEYLLKLLKIHCNEKQEGVVKKVFYQWTETFFLFHSAILYFTHLS